MLINCTLVITSLNKKLFKFSKHWLRVRIRGMITLKTIYQELFHEDMKCNT